MDRLDIWAVYETVLGQALPEAAVPGVKNLFEAGMACDQLYEEVTAACARICKRLGAANEDKDLEIVLDSMNRICSLVSQEMFRCGTLLGGNRSD